jgi:hypothetical protein
VDQLEQNEVGQATLLRSTLGQALQGSYVIIIIIIIISSSKNTADKQHNHDDCNATKRLREIVLIPLLS